MTKEEFIKSCIKFGYANRSDEKRIFEWCDKNSKDNYDDNDFIKIHRFLETVSIGDGTFVGKWRYIQGGHKSTKHFKNLGSDKRAF